MEMDEQLGRLFSPETQYLFTGPLIIFPGTKVQRRKVAASRHIPLNNFSPPIFLRRWLPVAVCVGLVCLGVAAYLVLVIVVLWLMAGECDTKCLWRWVRCLVFVILFSAVQCGMNIRVVHFNSKDIFLWVQHCMLRIFKLVLTEQIETGTNKCKGTKLAQLYFTMSLINIHTEPQNWERYSPHSHRDHWCWQVWVNNEQNIKIRE